MGHDFYHTFLTIILWMTEEGLGKKKKGLVDAACRSREARMQAGNARHTSKVDPIWNRWLGHACLEDAFAPRARLQLYAKVGRRASTSSSWMLQFHRERA